MAEYLNPKCAVPTFLLENESIAMECGRYTGYFIAIILTIIVVAVALYLYYALRNKDYEQNNRIIKYALITIIIVLGIWLFFPAIFSWTKKMHLRGYHEQINSYVDHGFSTKDAIDKTQSLYQTGIQADAITSAATIIASASSIRNSK